MKKVGGFGKDNFAFSHGNAVRKNKSKEYKAWCHMKSRCTNLKNKDYKYYGGRGITVCKRWINSFENFLADLGRAPSPKYSIDRINVNGNYTPKNCRWATQSAQMQNARITKNESGFRGLSKKLVRNGVWNGNYQVMIGKKYLGFVSDVKAGAMMYDRAAIKGYGEHALLNFPKLKTKYLKELSNEV
jgi:hypothetical protein